MNNREDSEAITWINCKSRNTHVISPKVRLAAESYGEAWKLKLAVSVRRKRGLKADLLSDCVAEAHACTGLLGAVR